MEDFFSRPFRDTRLNPIVKTIVGYTGGSTPQEPTYDDLGDHVEAILIEFNPSISSLASILTSWLDNGGRISTVFYLTDDQRNEATSLLTSSLMSDHRSYANNSKEVLPRLEKVNVFYRAEEYHQQYLGKNGLSKTCM